MLETCMIEEILVQSGLLMKLYLHALNNLNHLGASILIMKLRAMTED